MKFSFFAFLNYLSISTQDNGMRDNFIIWDSIQLLSETISLDDIVSIGNSTFRLFFNWK